MKSSLFVKACVAGSLIAVVALGGCGRRGSLERPSSSPASAQADPATYGDAQPQAAPKPDKPFILDALI